jgi:ribosomal protein S18 acetylase RimI-like enzyme
MKGTSKLSSVITRTIDALTPNELEQLVDVLIATVDDGASIGFLPPLSREEARSYWEDALGPGVILLVAEEAGRIAGTVQLHLSLKLNGRHRAEIARLMVHPDFRRRGIGRLLMERAEAVAIEQGRTLIVLDTREGDPSNDLYRGVGYIEAGRIPHYARSASGSLDATVFYYKELSSDERVNG